jgi:hypothetical protein
MPTGMTGAETLAFFGADAPCLWGHTLCGIFGDAFAQHLIDCGEETLEETPEYRIYRDRFGVITKELRGQSNIPLHLAYTFNTAADWPRRDSSTCRRRCGG